MSALLKGVEGGLTELQGDAFIYQDVDHRTLGGEGLGLLLPVLYVTKSRADVTRHIVCDVTKGKEKALQRILTRLRQVGGLLSRSIMEHTLRTNSTHPLELI